VQVHASGIMLTYGAKAKNNKFENVVTPSTKGKGNDTMHQWSS